MQQSAFSLLSFIFFSLPSGILIHYSMFCSAFLHILWSIWRWRPCNRLLLLPSVSMWLTSFGLLFLPSLNLPIFGRSFSLLCVAAIAFVPFLISENTAWDWESYVLLWFSSCNDFFSEWSWTTAPAITQHSSRYVILIHLIIIFSPDLCISSIHRHGITTILKASSSPLSNALIV